MMMIMMIMMRPFPYLRSGLTECAEIWCVVRDMLGVLQKSRVGYICTCEGA